MLYHATVCAHLLHSLTEVLTYAFRSQNKTGCKRLFAFVDGLSSARITGYEASPIMTVETLSSAVSQNVSLLLVQEYLHFVCHTLCVYFPVASDIDWACDSFEDS